MKRRSLSLFSASLLALFATACGEDTPAGYVAPTINPARNPTMTFFVTSEKHLTGNLGGLAGADRICQTLGEAGGGLGKIWKAYLSAERGPDGGPVHARDRIGRGPWLNVQWLAGCRRRRQPARRRRPQGRSHRFHRRAGPQDQRSVGHHDGAQRARHPYRVQRGRHPVSGRDVCGLDFGISGPAGHGRPL